jgi:predicted  nucleic acid-binding Zn-ribbon protein
MMSTGERVSRLEGAYEQVDRRLDDMNQRLNDMNLRLDDMNQRLNDMNQRINDSSQRGNTTIVLLMGSWVTTMAAIIGLYVRG